MVVGHELTHGFDDQGSLFAGNGAMSNWWSPEVSKKFAEKKQCVIDTYNAYEPLPGVHVNGELTLGENIADLGGVKLAFYAYRNLRKDAADKVVAGGFDEDQQFFLSVGQTWCEKRTDDIAKMLIQVDPHSPPRYRVHGAITNLPEFAEAFECKKGQPMAPENICSVW
jgi:putative endopeptidase